MVAATDAKFDPWEDPDRTAGSWGQRGIDMSEHGNAPKVVQMQIGRSSLCRAKIILENHKERNG